MKRFWNICIYLLWPWFKIYRDWRKAYNGLVSEKCLEKENPYPDCLLSWLPAAEQACLLWSHWCLDTNKGLQQRDFRRCAFWCLFSCCLWFHAWRWGWGHELWSSVPGDLLRAITCSLPIGFTQNSSEPVENPKPMATFSQCHLFHEADMYLCHQLYKTLSRAADI